jgi:ribosomal protein S12 methylthiotransferase accessory factor YcaO
LHDTRWIPVLSSLSLKSTKKHIIDGDNASTRIKPVQETLNDIIPICKKIGVTRLSDITYMDRLYIPNYSSILPGTEDSIWVYGGKGITKHHAKASALMESIERYSSFQSTYSKVYIQGSYSELSKSYNKVLHPDEVVEPLSSEFNDDSILDFINGFDIITNEEVLVPVQLALSKYITRTPVISPFPYSHTNGLASGNVIEEAIFHALCEVIERDAVSIADLSASFIPYTILKNIKSSLIHANYSSAIDIEKKFVDDLSIFPDVDISEIAKDYGPIKFLVEKFAVADIPLLIKDITQKDIGIPTFAASSIEWVNTDYGFFARGYGTSTHARTALIRAITEVSQTRAANIQGARDDLRKIHYNENDEIYKRKWQFTPCEGKLKALKFSEINSYSNEDILDDIKLILDHLRRAGLKRAIMINLTSPKVRIPVVRIIVPGLETFEVARLFTGNEAVMGDRAKKYFRRHLSAYH